MPLPDLKALRGKSNSSVASMEKAKAKDITKWTEEKQAELDAEKAYLSDIDDAILATGSEKEAKKEETQAPKKEEAKKEVKAGTGYIPEKGTEDMIHLRMYRGRRFNPVNGKEESVPFVQMFTRSEWKAFKDIHQNMGYTIVKVLHDPTGEAAGYELKDEK